MLIPIARPERLPVCGVKSRCFNKRIPRRQHAGGVGFQ